MSPATDYGKIFDAVTRRWVMSGKLGCSKETQDLLFSAVNATGKVWRIQYFSKKDRQERTVA